MDDKERPAIGKAVDKLNHVEEETKPKTAQATIDPDPEDVAGSANEQMYVPEATNAAASHSGRITPTYESMLPSFLETPRSKKKPTSNKMRKMPAKKPNIGTANKSAKKSTAKKKLTKPLKSSSAIAKKTRRKIAKKKAKGTGR